MILENKDPAIKLFGMKIPFPTVLEVAHEQDKNQNETSTDQSEKDKSLKKPTKILPCPRCDSMETKFCYYNNYNVNQPRHFCKACQRYWTSGGTMRSVPIGAGRRKNKNNNSSSSSHYPQITISETNSPVFSFSIGDNHQKFSNNRFVKPKLVDRIENNVDDSIDKSRIRANETNGLDCFQGASWNPAFYPVCPFWTIPMLSSPVHSSHHITLGKYSRDEKETMQGKQRDGSVLVPKTLRIDDPNEAAKSSIWTTLGIKNEGMFKGFDSMKNNKEETESSLVICANPASLSRSVSFHERT